jgi:hypothetical protein
MRLASISSGAPGRLTWYAAEVSLPSHGRSTLMLGIARSDSSISTGWCVGPSSPCPMESCVHT